MTAHPPIKLFQFPRMFAIPNVSPFCCKLETWLRIAGIPYEVVDTPDPRTGPRGKLPFIEDAGVRIADTSLIVDHLVKTRGVDPDARLDASQRAIALLAQRTLEEHYAFVLAYTHLLRDEGWQHMRTRFDSVPAIVRPLVGSLVRGRVKKMLWKQGVLRHSHEDIIESALQDWRAVLTVMSDGPFFAAAQPHEGEAAMTSDIARRMKRFTKPSRSIGQFPSIGTTAAALVQVVRQIVVAIKHRRELARLADLDDRMLADIGLRRSDLGRRLIIRRIVAGKFPAV